MKGKCNVPFFTALLQRHQLNYVEHNKHLLTKIVYTSIETPRSLSHNILRLFDPLVKRLYSLITYVYGNKNGPSLQNMYK